MTIKTKSVFQPADNNDGLRVLITRYYPRGIKREHIDYWVRELSPSPDLLFRYKQGKYSWLDFKTQLLIQLYNNVSSLEMINILHEYGHSEDVTLLCYEREGLPCHRHIVRDIVEAPMLLSSYFKPEHTNNHKRTSVEKLISHQETFDFPTLFPNS